MARWLIVEEKLMDHLVRFLKRSGPSDEQTVSDKGWKETT